MGYRRVTREDRLRIKDGLDAGLTNAEIADKLGFHRSTEFATRKRSCTITVVIKRS
jgi:IS30 family transposase